MSKGIGTKEERLLAMAEAYGEAAEHLKQDWCDTELERECGHIVSARLEKLAVKYTYLALCEGEKRARPRK